MVTFTEEILNEKLHFLCSVKARGKNSYNKKRAQKYFRSMRSIFWLHALHLMSPCATVLALSRSTVSQGNSAKNCSVIEN